VQIFYAPDITGDLYTLDERESRHSVRVLRMKSGSIVRLIDGNGNIYTGSIINADPQKCTIGITEVIKNFERREYRLHIAISPLKNPDRFEWFAEKCVEIGIDEITPVICRNTEKQIIKAERINKIIISAMKQSIKSVKTILNQPVSFDDFIDKRFSVNLLIATCSSSAERKKIADVYQKGTDTVILIGPEGDFDDTEVRNAMSKGFVPVHLGKSRLRTETAGIAACHSIYLLNQ
jgi:16S rRNA (uracil1498-N3)-methyltransferase